MYLKKVIVIMLALAIVFSNAGFAVENSAGDSTLSPYLNTRLVDASRGRSVFLETFEAREAEEQAARWVGVVSGLRQEGVFELSWEDALAELTAQIRQAAVSSLKAGDRVEPYIAAFSARFSELAAEQVTPEPETEESAREETPAVSSVEDSVEWITPEVATQRLQGLSILGNDDRLKEFCAAINREALDAGREPDYTKFIDSITPQLAVIKDILSRTRPVDELTRLEKENGVRARQLDILRSVSELASQLINKKEDVDNLTRLGQIKSVFSKHADISKLMIEYFEQRFDPVKKGKKGVFGATRDKIDEMIRALEPGDDKDVLSSALTILAAAIRTNYFIEDRASFFMKIDPRALLRIDKQKALAGDTPMAFIWVHVPYGAYGAHTRYSNLARGGLRSLHWSRTESLNGVLAESAGLADTQEIKHMSIPDGGSKGTYINMKDLQDMAVFIGYVEGLLDSMIYHEKIRRKRSDMVQAEPLKLGPDERTGKDGYADLAKTLAYMKNAPGWQSIMTGAVVMGGIPHKLNNLLGREGNRVTSQGVMQHFFLLTRYLIEKGRVVLSGNRPVVMPVTGGPEGDVAGGIIDIAIRHYGDGVLIPSFNDVSGVILAPKSGIPHQILQRMYEKDAAGEEGAFASSVSQDELDGVGGVVIPVKPPQGEDDYFELGPDMLQYLNTRALDPEILKELGVEVKFKEIAKLSADQPLVKVIDRDGANNHPTKVRVHRKYLQAALIFIVKGDVTATGFAHRYIVDDKTWQLFLGWDGKPVIAGMVHGANVVATPRASVELENAGVVIEPDEKANSVGVEVSDSEVNMNTVFDIFTEITRDVKAAFLKNRLAASREWARRKFFALRIESEERPSASVVTEVSVDMSLAVNIYKDLVEKSDLVGDKKEDYSPAVMAYLTSYFPELDSGKGGKYASTIDRVFDRMPASQIKAIAARKIAEDIVLNLGESNVRLLARELGVRTIDIIRAYVEVAYDRKIGESIKNIVWNDNASCGERLADLLQVRDELKKSVLTELASAKGIIDVVRGSMADISKHLQLRNLQIESRSDTRPIAIVMRQGLPEILTGDGRVISEAIKAKYSEMESDLRKWVGGNVRKVNDEAGLVSAVNDFIGKGFRVIVMDADDGILTKGPDISGTTKGNPHKQNYCLIKLQKRDKVEDLDRLSVPFVNLNAAALMGKGMLDSDEKLFAKAYRLFAGQEAPDRMRARVYQGDLWVLKVIPRIVQFSVEDLRQREELHDLFDVAA